MATTPAEAKKWIIPAIAIAGGTAAISDITNQKEFPRIRILIGAIIAGSLLSFLAEVEPGLAAGLASIILVGALLLKGGIFVKIAQLLQ